MTDKSVQQIRLSQFILSLGPGAIIESVNGPRLIPSLRSGLGKDFEGYAKNNIINDVRMENLISKENEDKKVKFFRLPINSSKENNGVYNTILFPLWHICHNNNKHEDSNAILYDTNMHSKCPSCGSSDSSPVRFISACANGHLDEVKWNYVVHDNNECYNKKGYYYWNSDGSSLSNITVICPVCYSKKTMQDIYTKAHNCTGRFPEKEVLKGWGVCKTNIETNKNCSEKMKIIQRQSTSLRLVQTRTLLKIPEYSNNIVKALTDTQIRVVTELAIKGNLDKETYIQYLNISGANPNYIKNLTNYINKEANSYEKLLKRAEFLYNNDKTYEDEVLEEFELLRQDKAITEDVLWKQPAKKYSIKINDNNFEFKVSSVDKISSVTVQTGYQRKPYPKKEENENGEETFISHDTIYIGEKIGNETWYPAVESEGEGIFITSDMNPLTSLHLDKFVEEWNNNTPIFKSNKNYKNPFFVWWHSFSHMIIKKLAYESGYSEATIRERIYYDKKNKRGGILLYTNSNGEDGSLGGLIELTKNFEEILTDSFKMIETCSSDPVCLDSTISSEKVNGAACVYCLLLSETSCEHNNMWLDRHLLLNK